MLSKKHISYIVFFISLFAGGYMLYQVLHKPWLPTEITLMRVGNSNEATLRSNKRDSITTYYYIVKNAPYTLKGRFDMVNDFLKKKSNIYPQQGSHKIEFSFDVEGWSFSTHSFPYFWYVDRSYKDNPLSYRDIGYDDRPDLDALIPYGGAEGPMGNDIASYSIDLSYKDCSMQTFLHVSKPSLFIENLVSNMEYDQAYIDSFVFRSGKYTPATPKCEGVVNEGDTDIKGLRL